MGALIVVGVVLSVVITYATLQDANKRDWSHRPGGPLFWGFLVLMFWPLFLPLYMLIRPRADVAPGWYRDVRREAAFRYWDGTAWTDKTSPIKGDPPSDGKTCPECAEEVKAAATKCRFCGHQFQDHEAA